MPQRTQAIRSDKSAFRRFLVVAPLPRCLVASFGPLPYVASMLAVWQNWRERHRHPGSLALHAVAIPMLVLAGVLVVVQLIDGAWNLWWRPVVLVIASYTLQWIGHAIEGNDMGEVILIKRLRGKPYMAVAPKKDAIASVARVSESARTEVRGSLRAKGTS